MLLGAAIGYERESRDSSAGMRRVIQGLLAGIGFLGAGAVIKQSDSGKVRGLTTAAGIWATAAIGMTVGLGRETTAIISTVFVLVILSVLLRLERHIVQDTH